MNQDLQVAKLPRIRRPQPTIFGRTVNYKNGVMDYYASQKSPDGAANADNIPDIPATLEGARTIAKFLVNDGTMVEAAGRCEDHRVFATGAMVANVIMKELVEDWAGSVDQVFDLLEPLFPAASGQAWPGRDALIARLVRDKVVRNGIGPRQMKPCASIPTTKEIGALVSQTSNIPMDQIVSVSRTRPVIQARFLMIWVMRTVCGMSLTSIGSHLGGRDHSTILSALQRIPEEREKDAAMRRQTDQICDKADEIGTLRHHSILARQYQPQLLRAAG